MPPYPPANDVNVTTVVGFALVATAAWYLYQVGSRKREWIRYKIRGLLVFVVIYAAGASVLLQQRVPPLEAAVISALAGLGCAWLLVRPPKGGRRIPKALRAQVIARDLTSKGLQWDSTKYHIDHIVPYSRGGDNSLRNLRVVQKERNLRKGSKLPRFRDFIER